MLVLPASAASLLHRVWQRHENATAVVLSLVALAALLQTKVKVKEPALVAVAALVGLALFA